LYSSNLLYTPSQRAVGDGDIFAASNGFTIELFRARWAQIGGRVLPRSADFAEAAMTKR
jgi:hypothetical protein